MTDPELATRPTAEPITAVIADRVRSLRERTGMSQAELAERMTALGTPWKRATVVNLEKRGTLSTKRGPAAGRDSITAQELLTLAVVFDVPPVWLLADPESAAPVPIAEGVELNPWTALLWMTGQQPLTDRPDSAWNLAAMPLSVAYEAATLIERFHELCRHRDRVTLFTPDESTADADQRRRDTDKSDEPLLRRLAKCLESLRDWKLPLPPVPKDVVTRAAELGVELPGQDG